MNTIGLMAGRIKFTENELAMSKGLMDAICDINIELMKKDGKRLNKSQKKIMEEKIYKIVSKTIWEYKKKFYFNREMTEDEFKEMSEYLFEVLFNNNNFI